MIFRHLPRASGARVAQGPVVASACLITIEPGWKAAETALSANQPWFWNCAVTDMGKGMAVPVMVVPPSGAGVVEPPPPPVPLLPPPPVLPPVATLPPVPPLLMGVAAGPQPVARIVAYTAQ